MIVTVTLNPSVDIHYDFSTDLKIDEVNRVESVRKTAGGKGLNVARVLAQLEEDVTATGFLGGHLGEFISGKITSSGIKDRFVRIADETRNCLAIMHEGNQTEILERGPSIQSEEQRQFLRTFRSDLEAAASVTISGSLPAGVDDDFYNELLTLTHERGTRVLLDTKGDVLKKAITHKDKPFLIKPNFFELQELADQPFHSNADIAEFIRSPSFSEIPWVVVTLGGEGAVVKAGEKVFEVKIPDVAAINPVGSGDAVIAGFASAFQRGMEDEAAIRYGLSMGISNATNPGTGEINRGDVESYMKEIQLELLSL